MSHLADIKGMEERANMAKQGTVTIEELGEAQGEERGQEQPAEASGEDSDQ